MNENEYKALLPLLESLKDVCTGIIAGSNELKDRLILEFKEELKQYFFFVRRLIKKEFETGTGMTFGKWTEFADKLSGLFEDIFNAVQNACDNCYKSEFENVSDSLARLGQAVKPFLENYGGTIEPLSKLQKWFAAAPQALRSAPPGVFREEQRRSMIENALKGAADLEKMIAALDEAKAKILTVINLKR